jgi:nucleoside-diphosphate-sugar epimerase
LKALVIGGTGPTGPHIIRGLVERGYEVAMLNRGSHDNPAIPTHIERLVGDPHFPETLSDVLRDRTFDLVVATYGRIRYVADVLADKTDRLITVGGSPGYRGYADPHALIPAGPPIPTPENATRVETEEEARFGFLIRTTEDALLAHHEQGHMNVTHFRYPLVYGPGQVRTIFITWVIQRCLDRRKAVPLANGGMNINTRGFSENMAHAVLLAVDHPDRSAGKIYNCGDDQQFSMAQWIELIAREMDHTLEIVPIPDAYASPGRELTLFASADYHRVLDLKNIYADLGYRDQVPAVDAVRRTVQWLRENPKRDEDVVAGIRAHYWVEDQLLDICRRAADAMASLEHQEGQFHHSYAHPRKPGLKRDHRKR